MISQQYVYEEPLFVALMLYIGEPESTSVTRYFTTPSLPSSPLNPSKKKHIAQSA